jgi:DNA-binding HxlR family transcriptional regulator
MSKKNPRQQQSGKCPITFALDMFGDKWSLIILRDIVFKGKKHYREFLDAPEKISTNILASRLKKMETEGLLKKTQDTQNLSRFVYRLTDKGKDLLPLLLEMIEWSVKYNPQADLPDNIISGAPPRLLERLYEDREALIDEIVSGLDEHSQ